MSTMSLPGKAVWNTAVAGTGNHSGDLAGTVKTKPFWIDNKAFSLVIVWTGTPTGTVTVYTSSSFNPMDPAAATDNWNGTWNSINGLLSPAITQPAGSGGSYELSSGTFSGRFLYVDYARTSGTGTMTVDYSVSAT